MAAFYKYGLEWHENWRDEPVRIEIEMVRSGGFKEVAGVKYGLGLFEHFKQLQILLWPENEDHHRWSDLVLKEILENRITVVGGARDTGKTHIALARYGLTDYFCWPEETLILMSSTHAQGLQLRVYGDVKDLLQRAKEIHPWLPGNIVESKFGIFTDSLGPQATIRDMRKGIICVPCVGGDGEWLEGLEKFIGVKQKRRRLLGDEVQFMDASYLNVMSNLDKGNFKGVFCGNFLGRGDPLDQLAEPLKGWLSIGDPKKTTIWENRKGGKTVNLIGTDSPNFDVGPNEPVPFPYLIDRSDVETVKRRYGEDSLQYWSQIKGVRKSDLMAHRILTMEICRKYGAFEPCTWESTGNTKIYALDAAFGGDRPVGGMIEFGRIVGGRIAIKVHTPRSLPLKITDQETPEEQLAKTMRDECLLLGIPPENVFYDAGMRATLAVQIGRLFSINCNAINFGGTATPRPVSSDDFVYDEKLRSKRLKRCDEAYSKFVTELNFSVRMVVEAGQMREIPEDVVREFEMREWYKVTGDRYELETKAETKKRMGFSPDLADWLAIAVEGARRLGFSIEGIREVAESVNEDKDWLDRELGKFKTYVRENSLKYG